ncbi:unnamed protein product [Linum tenue]|uniref:Cytochrome P450 n=1 Tax=Linum tenue TaxID=586396 RepID=A0AAV0KIR7_9ROSI|nr:unnamed protein product [Linum tenue]
MVAAGAYWLSLTLPFFLIAYLYFLLGTRLRRRNLPPSPPSLPIIGHLHLLSTQSPYRSLRDLSAKYGAVLLLRFGSRDVLVISSPSAVEQCFSDNDIAFANRPLLLGAKHLNYNHTTIGACNYGDRWRNLRRLTTAELFSPSRVAAFSAARRAEAGLMLKEIFREAESGERRGVNLSSKFRGFAFNTMLRMVAGKRYFGYGESDVVDKEAEEFRDLIGEFSAIQGTSTPNDFFPLLRWVDFQGLEKRMKSIMTKLDDFLQHLVDGFRESRSKSPPPSPSSSSEPGGGTLIDVMLSLQETEPEFYTDETIKGVILIMLVAGTETSSTTMEWAMSLLLNNPESMSRLVSEIEQTAGTDRLLDETDLPNLNYLHNVIDETLRLYPPVPLLIPHESSQETRVCGYTVPKGAMLLVNAWSLHRDPELWTEPERFSPERFEGAEPAMKRKENKYRLVPFGAGRRACPGDLLGTKVVAMALGGLVQGFELGKIDEGVEIDMGEGIGLTMARVHPLEVLCKPRSGIAVARLLFG